MLFDIYNKVTIDQIHNNFNKTNCWTKVQRWAYM